MLERINSNWAIAAKLDEEQRSPFKIKKLLLKCKFEWCNNVNASVKIHDRPAQQPAGPGHWPSPFITSHRRKKKKLISVITFTLALYWVQPK